MFAAVELTPPKTSHQTSQPHSYSSSALLVTTGVTTSITATVAGCVVAIELGVELLSGLDRSRRARTTTATTTTATATATATATTRATATRRRTRATSLCGPVVVPSRARYNGVGIQFWAIDGMIVASG